MSSHHESNSAAPLDLSKWRNVPNALIGVGAVLTGIALVKDVSDHAFDHQKSQFMFSWLQAFMFYLSIGLGGFFLTMLHHIFDASWSVPIRRVTEHLGCLLKWLAVLFIPIAIYPKAIYAWMSADPLKDEALAAKQPLFTTPGFYVVSLLCFGLWILYSSKLRAWSLKQDETGSAECTYKMRFYALSGILLFAVTVTLGVFMWMKSLEYHWFSTMYGVYYFAGSTWLTLAIVYVIVALLKRQGPLKDIVAEKQFYFIGSLLFAFTVFYAYVHFAQYFIIWNGNMPEETFYYLKRENGTWYQIGMVIIFGHFFLPFLALLRIDVKLKLWWMFPLAIWAWLMHYCDVSFNIMPLLHGDNFVLHYADLGCMALMGGFLTKMFIKDLYAHPFFPQKDPRIAETLGVYLPPANTGKAATGGAH